MKLGRRVTSNMGGQKVFSCVCVCDSPKPEDNPYEVAVELEWWQDPDILIQSTVLRIEPTNMKIDAPSFHKIILVKHSRGGKSQRKRCCNKLMLIKPQTKQTWKWTIDTIVDMYFFLGKFSSPLLPPSWCRCGYLWPCFRQRLSRRRPTSRPKKHQRCFPKSRKLRYAYGFGAFAIVAAAVVWQHLFNL